MSFAIETNLFEGNQLESIVKVVGKQYENELKTYKNINAGLAMGDVRVFLTFFTLYADLLLTFPFDELFTLVYTDQDVINGLIRGNKSRDAGIPTMLYGDSGPIHILWRRSEIKGAIYEIGEYRAQPDVMYPLVVHQFDRSRPLAASLIVKCQQEFETGDTYVRV
jgi:hypothetical protein